MIHCAWLQTRLDRNRDICLSATHDSCFVTFVIYLQWVEQSRIRKKVYFSWVLFFCCIFPTFFFCQKIFHHKLPNPLCHARQKWTWISTFNVSFDTLSHCRNAEDLSNLWNLETAHTAVLPRFHPWVKARKYAYINSLLLEMFVCTGDDDLQFASSCFYLFPFRLSDRSLRLHLTQNDQEIKRMRI